MINTDECWLYALYKNKRGYGTKSNGSKIVQAHRFMYEALIAEIPKGYHLHHLCRVPACINPAHLQPMRADKHFKQDETPPYINSTKIHCIRGHKLEGNNLEDSKRGWRECRRCHIERSKRSYQRRKELGLV